MNARRNKAADKPLAAVRVHKADRRTQKNREGTEKNQRNRGSFAPKEQQFLCTKRAAAPLHQKSCGSFAPKEQRLLCTKEPLLLCTKERQFLCPEEPQLLAVPLADACSSTSSAPSCTLVRPQWADVPPTRLPGSQKTACTGALRRVAGSLRRRGSVRRVRRGNGGAMRNEKICSSREWNRLDQGARGNQTGHANGKREARSWHRAGALRARGDAEKANGKAKQKGAGSRRRSGRDACRTGNPGDAIESANHSGRGPDGVRRDERE